LSNATKDELVSWFDQGITGQTKKEEVDAASKHKCCFCNKHHTTRQALYYHKKQCVKVKEFENKDINELKEMLKAIQATLQEKTCGGVNIGVCNNVFVVNSFGDEKIDHLPPAFLSSVLPMVGLLTCSKKSISTNIILKTTISN
jgi:hypothetical protein